MHINYFKLIQTILTSYISVTTFPITDEKTAVFDHNGEKVVSPVVVKANDEVVAANKNTYLEFQENKFEGEKDCDEVTT